MKPAPWKRHAFAAAIAFVFFSYHFLGLSWRDAALAAIVFGFGAFLLPRLGSPRWRRPLLGFWFVAFTLDLGIKAFLVSIYQTKPDAVLILDAISNTNGEETAEFVAQYWRQIGLYVLIGLAFCATLVALQWLRPAPPARLSRGATIALALFALLHFNPTFGRSNPLVFWPQQVDKFEEFQDQLAQIDDKRRLAMAALADWNPQFAGSDPQTVAVVIGESTNRWNWQLYGYPRETNPQLTQQRDGLLVFRDVISGTSGTVSSFRMMMTRKAHDLAIDDESEPSVVLLAKTAGYKTFWISNQHDRYINPRYAAEADVTRIVNVGGGRGDKKLDEGVLPHWHEALADPAPRKLIIVHLLGAHPHYEMRSPEGFKKFSGVEDGVIAEMESTGRSEWTQMQRNSYDNVMLYQDHVIAELLRSFKTRVGDGHGAFLFTADHAQEVGHTRDFAGHTASEPGHTVPFLLWLQPQPAAATQWLDRPYQTDTLDWTVLDLLDIRTRHDQPDRSLIAEHYVTAPRIIDKQPYTPSALAKAH